ncbi:MAG: flagellar hook capping FlgD N-terminal domain-containing protein [Terracidiphilus sp.]
MTAAQASTEKAANPMATPADASGGTATSSGSSATISSSDFLTLLVTEMQNQDPTADTDPNEYITQLVQVNSLEELISINQNLSTALGTSSANSTGTATTGQAAAVKTATTASGLPVPASPTASPPGRGSGRAAQVHTRAASGVERAARSGTTAAAISQFSKSAGALRAPGNLSIPETTSASGSASVGQAGNGGRGTINGSSLEASNVNISAEFSDLIVAQRAFEANSKAVTTFDSVTEETINMIH